MCVCSSLLCSMSRLGKYHVWSKRTVLAQIFLFIPLHLAFTLLCTGSRKQCLFYSNFKHKQDFSHEIPSSTAMDCFTEWYKSTNLRILLDCIWDWTWVPAACCLHLCDTEVGPPHAGLALTSLVGDSRNGTTEECNPHSGQYFLPPLSSPQPQRWISMSKPFRGSLVLANEGQAFESQWTAATPAVRSLPLSPSFTVFTLVFVEVLSSRLWCLLLPIHTNASLLPVFLHSNPIQGRNHDLIIVFGSWTPSTDLGA